MENTTQEFNEQKLEIVKAILENDDFKRKVVEIIEGKVPKMINDEIYELYEILGNCGIDMPTII